MKESTKCDSTTMKTRLVSFLCLMLLTSQNAAEAQDRNYTMYVNLTDGTNVQFVLSEKNPLVESYNGKMTVYYGDFQTTSDSDGAEREKLVLESNQVKDLTFSKATGIEKTEADNDRLFFDLSHTGGVRVRGAKANDHIEVLSLDGKIISTFMNQKHDFEIVVDLSTKPSGIYMISVNKRFTFKFLKP